MKRFIPFLPAFAVLAILAFRPAENIQQEADAFIAEYTAAYQKLYTESSEAEWKSNTMIVEGDSTNAVNTRRANEAVAAFMGSYENMAKAMRFKERSSELNPITAKQIELIVYYGANSPEAMKEQVAKRIKADAESNEKLFGFHYNLNGKEVTTNDLDEILRTETNLVKRQQAWECSKESGSGLKPNLMELRNLRNEVVRPFGYSDFFAYQVSEYGMTVDEMMTMNRNLVRDIWPLYRELHTWMRSTLQEKYNSHSLPNYLPAHWLPNRWGQDWSSTVEVEGVNLDGALKARSAEWLVKQAEQFYVSIGYQPLPASFYEKSSLYPLPPDATWKKNNHASAWHINLERDVRSLMSVEPNTEWYETTHHELGHIYYYLTYTNPDVPPILRGGANRAYHEAMGSLLGLAAMQKPFLEGLELVPKGTQTDEVQMLLKEALNYIVFIPFSAGVMTEFEYNLYSKNLDPNAFNQTWWHLVKKYQGIEPPAERGESFCDACTKTHIINDAAQYYDYALSYIILFQLHDYISKNILKQDPHATNYYGNKEVGNFLKTIMYPGASKDWRQLLKETTGQEITAKPMLDYFQPLMSWLKEQNQNKTHTLPEVLN